MSPNQPATTEERLERLERLAGCIYWAVRPSVGMVVDQRLAHNLRVGEDLLTAIALDRDRRKRDDEADAPVDLVERRPATRRGLTRRQG